jgi:hypothetical protein
MIPDTGQTELRPTVKIYGERNTGTNFLFKLLRLNLRADLLRGVVPSYVRIPFPQNETVRDLYFKLTFGWNLGWKHRLAPSPDSVRETRIYSDRLCFVTLTKNPYSWLLSLYRRPHHYQGELTTFEQFLNAPWTTVRRANAPPEFPNPIIMWNEKSAAYLRLREGMPTATLRYEDLLADPERALSRVAVRFSIEKSGSYFENVTASTKEKGGGKGFEYYQQYYLGEQWRTELQPAALRIINEYLDFELMSQFGYERLEDA